VPAGTTLSLVEQVRAVVQPHHRPGHPDGINEKWVVQAGTATQVEHGTSYLETQPGDPKDPTRPIRRALGRDQVVDAG